MRFNRGIALVLGTLSFCVTLLQANTKVTLYLTPGSVKLAGGQSQQFAATVQGTSNQNVTWSLSPSVGTITTGGLYKAPAIIGVAQTIKVIATSAVQSKSTSAVVSLIPVTVQVSPSSSSLTGGQSVQLSANVTGTINTAVTWSVSPTVGTVSNGLYTAPAIVGSSQTVAITAASIVDPTKTATASISLVPVAIAISPGTASLAAGQTAQCTASLSGTYNTGVTWSLSPAIGTIANGLYTAPASLGVGQSVTVIATSMADSTKTAQASVTLTPPISVSVSPSPVTLSSSQTQQFTATVQNASNTGVTWAVVPTGAGTITPGGLYTAPSSISSQQSVAITATSIIDTTKTGSATVTLQPAVQQSPPASTTITLPLEVVGLDGKTVSANFTIPVGSNLSGATLWMKIHGLHYDTQASVQVNNGAWMPISTGNVTLLGLANANGGIGGGFHTFQMTMNLPAGAVVAGTNTITFRFNGTNGRVSGFRVLGFNIWDVNSNPLVSSSTFTWDDPTTWQPPSTAASDISAGQTLWYTAALTRPGTNGPVAIQAHCTDCHAQDGRDLKYFNYSNNSIRTRSMFHGLTAQQGDQIASYIRTLNVPNPGRPWNPPYQPGPGLDSQPATNWAAGAGLDAVLQSSGQMVPYLMPSGSTANWAPSANLSAREIPLTMQLPDWNMWLPSVHPVDEWGNAFLTNQVYTNYKTIRANLVPNSPTTYSAQKGNIWYWQILALNFINPLTLGPTDPGWSDPQYAAAVPSLYMWSMTKLWEINQEFGLEPMAQTAFGSQADSRAWYSSFPFDASPNMQHLPTSVVGNGSNVTYNYLSTVWYQVQLILNYSNNRGTHLSQSADWPYSLNHVDSMAYAATPTTYPGPLEALWLIKGLQASENGNGPEYGSAGWALNVNDPSRLVRYATEEWGPDVSPTDKLNMMQTYLQYWIAKATSFTPTEYYQGGWASPTQVPDPNWPANGISNAIAFMIPQFKYQGVSSTILNQLVAWAQTIWPAYNWQAELNAVCVPGVQHPACTW